MAVKMNQTLLMCRAGFESDLAAEIQEHATLAGLAGFVRAQTNTGYVVYEAYEGGRHLTDCVKFADLIFARQWMRCFAHLDSLDPADRVTDIMTVLEAQMPAILRRSSLGQCWLSFPDTNEGKGLSRLTRKLETPLRKAVEKRFSRREAVAGLNTGLNVHLFFLSGQSVWVGVTDSGNGSPWALGFPRLRQPSSAPSRSTLKLEEAWLQLISESDRALYLKPFQKAVDLGAAPGGWTWQLVNRGMQVVAIDNGPMNKDLMESGQVEHLREDAFSYRPPRQVDWLVCDMVEKPARVAELMERWLVQGWTRYAIFNLKLPMKRRWLEVNTILQRMRAVLAHEGSRYRLSARQLYHDREEITVFAEPLP